TQSCTIFEHDGSSPLGSKGIETDATFTAVETNIQIIFGSGYLHVPSSALHFAPATDLRPDPQPSPRLPKCRQRVGFHAPAPPSCHYQLKPTPTPPEVSPPPEETPAEMLAFWLENMCW